MAARLPRLAGMLAGYLHQDYDLEFGSVEAALEHFATHSSEGAVAQVLGELLILSTTDFSEELIRDYLIKAGSAHAPLGPQRPWLSEVGKQIAGLSAAGLANSGLGASSLVSCSGSSAMRLVGLGRMLAGYLHQDYDLEFGSPEAVCEHFATHSSEDAVAQVLGELLILLSSDLDEDSVIAWLDGVGCYYRPPGPQRMWLNDMARQIASVAARRLSDTGGGSS